MIHARVHTLSFELPRVDSDVVIRAEIHQVTEQSGEVTFTTGTTNEIFRRLSDVATESVTFFDPVRQTNHTISVAALAQAVTQSVRAWMAEDIPGGQFNDDQKYIIEE